MPLNEVQISKSMKNVIKNLLFKILTVKPAHSSPLHCNSSHMVHSIRASQVPAYICVNISLECIRSITPMRENTSARLVVR